MNKWKWKYFSYDEIKCKGKQCCHGEIYKGEKQGMPYPEWFVKSMDMIEELRRQWRNPIILNSAHRCETHNTRVGGSKNSQHLQIAFDCQIAKSEQAEFIELAEKIGFNGIGTYNTFIHLDARATRARWNG